MARNINYQVNLTVNKSGLDELLLSLKSLTHFASFNLFILKY